jgi:hypothetical protein
MTGGAQSLGALRLRLHRPRRVTAGAPAAGGWQRILEGSEVDPENRISLWQERAGNRRRVGESNAKSRSPSPQKVRASCSPADASLNLLKQAESVNVAAAQS